MGKDITQMIEAVADAATGEFERLKEFGIKAWVEEYQEVKTLVRLVDHIHKKLVAMAAAAPPA